MSSKFEGAVGLAKVGSSISYAAPVHYPVCETVDAPGVLQVAERINNRDRIPLKAAQQGKDFNFSIDGCEPWMGMWGYFLWLWLADDTWSTDHHILKCAANGHYFCLSIDRTLDLTGTSKPTLAYLGCKIGSMTLEFPPKAFAKLNVSGMCCSLYATEQNALSPTLPAGANNVPLSWASLDAGSAVFQTGIGDPPATPTDDTNVQSLKYEFSNPQQGSGLVLGQTTWADILEGQRKIQVEFTKEFTGAKAKDMYTAWKNGQAIHLIHRFDVGSYYCQITIPRMYISGPVLGEVGAGEDSVMCTVQATAEWNETDELITVLVKDQTSGVYT